MSGLIDANRWRRMGWPRIILYFLCIVLVIHLFHTFSISTSSPSTTTPTTALTSQDFPWYSSPHPKLTQLQDSKYTTTNLSTDERSKLTAKMISQTKELVQKEDFYTSIQGIPGSIYNGKPAEANQFRSLVDCWTKGEWVQVPHKKNVMPHFQDPLYGSCERKFNKKPHADGEQRKAVKYVWKSSCEANLEVDGANWCEVLNGRHLLLVGDLVQYQLHELFLDTLRDGPTVCFGELNCKGKDSVKPIEKKTPLRALMY
jgi:signal peptidase I